MVQIVTSDNATWNITLPSINNPIDIESYRVLDSNGRITKPDPKIYAELIAAQTAFLELSRIDSITSENFIGEIQALFPVITNRASEIELLQASTVISTGLQAAGSLGALAIGLSTGNPPLALTGLSLALVAAVNGQLTLNLQSEIHDVYSELFTDQALAFLTDAISFDNFIDSGASFADGATVSDILLQYERLLTAETIVPAYNSLFEDFDKLVKNLDSTLPSIQDVLTSVSPSLAGLYIDSLQRSRLPSQSALELQLVGIKNAITLIENNFDISKTASPALKTQLENLEKTALKFAQNDLTIKGLGFITKGLTAYESIFSLIQFLNIKEDTANFKSSLTDFLLEIDRLQNERLVASFSTESARTHFESIAELLPILGELGVDDNILGTDGNDVIDGDFLASSALDAGNDIIQGLAGKDRIIGGPGNDVIDGGADDDIIIPGLGLDQINTGAGGDTVRGSIAELNDDFVVLDFGDVIEISDDKSLLPAFDTSALTVETDGSLTIDFDGDGTPDLTIRSGLTGNLRPVVQGVVDDLGTRTVSIRIGDNAAFVIDQPLNSGFASIDQATLGGMTRSGETFRIGQTNINDGPSDPELRNLAVTDTGSVFTVFEYDAGENLSFGLDNILPQLFPGDSGGAIVELDPETGGFLESTIRAFSHASGGSVPNIPADFGVTNVESINALAPLGNGEFLAIGEFRFSSTNPIRTLEGGPDFAFKIKTSGETEFLKNWSVFGDGDGTRTIAADTSPITGKVYAWRDYTKFYGGGVLLEVNTSTGEPSVVVDFFGGANATDFEITSISFESDGTLIGLGGDQFGNGTIFEIDPVGKTITPVEFIRGEFFPWEFDLFGDFQFKPETIGTSDDDTLNGTDGADRIEGGLGDDILFGLGGDDDIFAGGGSVVIYPGFGNDVIDIFDSQADVRGSLAELNGDRILGFDHNDTLTFLGTVFSFSNIFLSLGSLEISIDADGDGTVDSFVTLDGDFNLDQPLIVENDTDGNTTIRLGEVNSVPVANNDTFQVLSNDLVFGNILSNDSDENDNALFIHSIDGAIIDQADPVQTIGLTSGAKVAFLIDGSLIYDPRGAFSNLAEGTIVTDSFTYVASDGKDVSETATVFVNVTGAAPNTNPIAGNDMGVGYETNEDNAFTTANVLSNDTDVDAGDVLSVSAVDTTGTAGLVIDNGNGTFNYDPNGVFESLGIGDSATDSFVYTVSDGKGGSDTATVTIHIAGVNDDPVAADDAVGTVEDNAVIINVLNGDSDPENDNLTVVSVGAATNGTPVINPDNTVIYTPNLGFFGSDSFTYTVDDGHGGIDTANVTVTVTQAPNQIPNASPITVGFGEEETGRQVDLLSTASDLDGDDLDIENVVVTTADGRTLTGSINAASGLLTLDDSQFDDLSVGALFDISVTYDVTDGLDSVGNTATITITGENDDPIATDDGNPDPTGFITDEDTQFTTSNVLLNDTDADSGDVLSISSIDTTGTVGLVTDNGNGTFNYDPNGAFESLGVGDSATDSFVYTVSDGNGGSDTAAVTITVQGVNDNPVAADDAVGTVEDNAVIINVLNGDSDPENDNLTVVSVGAATNGTPVINPDNTVIYTPNLGFFGSDSFTYTVDDGHGGIDTANVTVTVTQAPNQIPNASPITVGFGEEETGRQVDLLSTASDLDGDDLDIENVVVTTADGRTLTGSINAASGLLTLDDSQFDDLSVGALFDISVTYDVTDGLDSVGNTATITITGENDDPIATDDGNPDPTGFITDEDTQFTTSNVLLNDTDADSGDVLSISSIDTTGTVGLVTDNGNGTFNYDPNGAFESLGVGDSATDSFVYTVSDGNGGVDTATVTINISGVNDIPVISSQNSAAVNENTLVVGQLVANDPDAGDTLVISIEGGADAGLFTFDNSGIFSFVTAPDFELPSDFDNNNIYEITVGVSDGKVLVTQDVTITVSDVNEGGSPNIIEGTASSDNLIGTNTEDILFGHGGAFDFFTGNSGADIFVFTATPGNGREIGTINDYVPGEDSIDLDGSVVSSSFGFGLSTYLFLDGGDFDTLIVNGVGSVNDITFV